MNTAELSALMVLTIGAPLRDWRSGPGNSGTRLRWFNHCMAAVLVVSAGFGLARHRRRVDRLQNAGQHG
jgi:hypothetical protein